MRTTIQLPDELLDQARRLALDSGATLTSIIEGALRERLARSSAPSARPVKLTTFGALGLQPGVDLDDGANLLDLMEER